MADYKAARAKTDANEGGFAANPNDKGGMTYKGITSKFWPNWRGWTLVKAAIATMVNMPKYGASGYFTWCKFLNKTLAGNAPLQRYVDEFYETNFWHANRLEELISQAVAEWIYDHAVNAGARGIMWAQLAAGAKPDGDLGKKSVAAINAMDPTLFLTRVEDIAGAYRLDKAHEDPSQIQFLNSWLERDGQPAEIIAMVRTAARDGRLDDGELTALNAAMVATA